MITVVLHGALAEAMGKAVWTLDVRSVSEAIRAIEANTGRFYKYLSSEHRLSQFYRVRIDGKDFSSLEELILVLKFVKKIEFIPVLAGQGDFSIFQIIAGILLIAVAVVLIPVTGGGSVALTSLVGAKVGFLGFIGAQAGGYVAGALIGLGLSLTLGGIASLLTKTPSAGSVTNESAPTFNFGGAINSSQQGAPIPVGYGMRIVGSQVVSAGVETIDLPV